MQRSLKLVAYSVSAVVAVLICINALRPNLQSRFQKCPCERTSQSIKSALPEPATAKPRKLNQCHMDVYSTDELNTMCSLSVPRPNCLVTRIDHLDQGAFLTADLKLPGDQGTRKIIISPLIDPMSSEINYKKSWELSSVSMVLRALNAIPGSALIDIGSNLGVYSLTAAANGRTVVAVDANYQLSMRLRKTAEVNGLTQRMSVYWNAISMHSGSIKLRYPGCDFAVAIVKKSASPDSMVEDPNETATAELDGILLNDKKLEKVKDIIIKVDVESSEWNVIGTAAKTFSRFTVRMVLMEWEWVSKKLPDSARLLINFMTERQFSAFKFNNGKLAGVLNPADGLKNWPADVVWLHKDSGLKDLLS